MAASWADQEAATAPGAAGPAVASPGAQRLAAALAHLGDEDYEPQCMYDAVKSYWQMRDRQHGQVVRDFTSLMNDLVASYLLGRQDQAQLHDDLDEDRPSGALAMVAGIVYGALLVLGLLGVGVVLGFVRFGGW